MTDAAPPPAATYVWRALSILVVLATFIGNVIPLYGVLYWQWDTFELLMLYWMETAIIAFWTMIRLSRLNADEPQARSRASSTRYGEITVNGRPRPATPFALVGFFSLHAGLFITVHFVFLWAFFSHDWFKKVHGVGSFFAELLVVNYIWAALLFMIIASGVSFLIDRARARPQRSADGAGAASDPVGAIVGGLYARIVIMQVAIIFGAIISGMAGSLAPLVIVIVLKTLVDIGVATAIPILKNLDFSAQSKKLKIEM